MPIYSTCRAIPYALRLVIAALLAVQNACFDAMRWKASLQLAGNTHHGRPNMQGVADVHVASQTMPPATATPAAVASRT